MNWRDLIAAPVEIFTPPPQNTQNTQNRETKGIIAHSANIAGRVVAEMLAPVFDPHIVHEGPTLPLSAEFLPLQSGWRIAYMDNQWRLAGGYDDPTHAMVQGCRRSAGVWFVTRIDGQEIPCSRVRSVAALDHKGRLYAVWNVRDHGIDGKGSRTG